MNILLDECVPARLARELAPHSVTTVQRRGWAGIKNGDLLALAQNEFDVLITVDRKISEEQDLTNFTIAPVLLLRAATNRLEHLRPLASKIVEKIADAPAGPYRLSAVERPVAKPPPVIDIMTPPLWNSSQVTCHASLILQPARHQPQQDRGHERRAPPKGGRSFRYALR